MANRYPLVLNGTSIQELQSADALSITSAVVSGSVTLNGGTANQVQYLNASKTLTGSANLTFDGTTLTAAAFSGPLTGNVTGTATNVTGVVAAANGGTGATTAAGALTNLGASPAAGSSSITTVGTIGTGTWQGTAIGSTYGGTGVNNGGRTITIGGTNNASFSFTTAATTLTVANTASVSGTNTGDQTITLTGDVTGSGTGSFAATLANSGVTAGTYTFSTVTVDAKGRVTSASSGTAPSTFNAGTVMLFQQTAAPTGWTKLTTQNDKALRVVSGTAGTGGTAAFSAAFASQTPSGSVSVNISGVSAAATTLSTTQMPSHTHSTTFYGSACMNSSAPGLYNGQNATGIVTSSAGGGGSHTHSLTGTATGAFTGNAINLAVQYVDVILASKN